MIDKTLKEFNDIKIQFPNKVSLLFVCRGGICRSPAAVGVFKRYVTDRNYTDHFLIDSAGTIAYHEGESADPRMCKLAAKRNYQINSIARKVTLQDIQLFDLIVVMDNDNLLELEAMAGGKKTYIRLLGSFMEGYEGSDDVPVVPGPYYGKEADFTNVLDMIELACPMMLSYCLDLLNKKSA